LTFSRFFNFSHIASPQKQDKSRNITTSKTIEFQVLPEICTGEYHRPYPALYHFLCFLEKNERERNQGGTQKKEFFRGNSLMK